MNKPKSYTKVERQNHYNGGIFPVNNDKYYSGGITPQNYKDKVLDENIDNDTLRYYNASFTNTTGLLQVAELEDTRASAILDNPSEWLMSVIRFDIDCRSIPINIPDMQVIGGVPSNTLTTSFITIKYQGNYYTKNIIYVESSIIPAIPYPIPAIYNYQRWLNFVNTALSLAFTDTAASGFPPQFIFNPLTGLIDLYIDNNFMPSAGVNQMSIFVNSPLSYYLSNFDFAAGTEIITNPLYAFKLLITNTNTLVMPAIGSRYNLPQSIQLITPLFLNSQIAKGTANWSSLRSIILSSSALPIKFESVPTKTTQSANYNSNNVAPILTDFLVPVENDVTNTRIVEQYLPTSQYRYLDLIGIDKLFKVNFSMQWTDYLGRVFPIFIFPGASMNIKLLFQKRKLALPK
jgi:hypothetical protein